MHSWWDVRTGSSFRNQFKKSYLTDGKSGAQVRAHSDQSPTAVCEGWDLNLCSDPLPAYRAR